MLTLTKCQLHYDFLIKSSNEIFAQGMNSKFELVRDNCNACATIYEIAATDFNINCLMDGVELKTQLTDQQKFNDFIKNKKAA